MYDGDKFIDLGSLEYLSKKYDKSIPTLKWMSYPVAHKRKRKLLLYRIEDDK